MSHRILWARIDPWDKEMAIAALESGVSTLWLPDGCAPLARELGRVTVVAADGDLAEGRDFHTAGIETAADEARIAASPEGALWVVRPSGREIIPLENLVAWRRRILVEARTTDEISLYLGVLEKGVAGLVLRADSPEAMRRLASAALAEPERIPLVEARVTAIELLGVGDRVCVDTCSLIAGSKGMLVGNSSAGLFLVCAENIANPYVLPRPFRVNAGAVHSYCRVGGGKTAYLSELAAGNELLLVDEQGICETATVGRAKIERRPLLLIRAKTPSGREHTVILQNAETIRVVGEGGKAVSVAALAAGDTVLVAEEAAGRHFGVAVEESIREN